MIPFSHPQKVNPNWNRSLNKNCILIVLKKCAFINWFICISGILQKKSRLSIPINVAERAACCFFAEKIFFDLISGIWKRIANSSCIWWSIPRRKTNAKPIVWVFLKMVHDLALRVMKRYRIRFFLGYGKTVFRPFLGKSISHCFKISLALPNALGQAYGF